MPQPYAITDDGSHFPGEFRPHANPPLWHELAQRVSTTAHRKSRQATAEPR